jgi:hypothetical protein
MPSENNLELGGMPYLSQMWQQYWPHLTDTWAQTRGVSPNNLFAILSGELNYASIPLLLSLVFFA